MRHVSVMLGHLQFNFRITFKGKRTSRFNNSSWNTVSVQVLTIVPRCSILRGDGRPVQTWFPVRVWKSQFPSITETPWTGDSTPWPGPHLITMSWVLKLIFESTPLRIQNLPDRRCTTHWQPLEYVEHFFYSPRVPSSPVILSVNLPPLGIFLFL